jgi:hypothetical protein
MGCFRGFHLIWWDIAGSFAIPQVGFHGYQVDHTFEIMLFPDGKLYFHQALSSRTGELLHGSIRLLVVGIVAIQLVDDHEPGEFKLIDITPGDLRPHLQTGNRIIIGEPATVNATLEPGGVAETIEVKAQSEVVQVSTSGNIGTNFEQKTIEALPILGGRGRNPLDLVLTQPGVVSGANTGGGTHVHGARDRSWNFTLDGIDNNESSAGGSNFAPLRTNPDAIAEFQVLTGNQTAEFGRNSGGQVAMVTRSGTNDFGARSITDRRPSTTPTSGRTTSTGAEAPVRRTCPASAWAGRSGGTTRSSS